MGIWQENDPSAIVPREQGWILAFAIGVCALCDFLSFSHYNMFVMKSAWRLRQALVGILSAVASFAFTDESMRSFCDLLHLPANETLDGISGGRLLKRLFALLSQSHIP